MKTIIIVLYSWWFFFINENIAQKTEKPQQEIHANIRQTVIADFLKSRFSKKNTVFHISFTDTVQHKGLKKLDDGRYKWVRDKIYPDIIAADIRSYPNQFFLDTTISINKNKWIPSQCVELEGKLFIWYDDSYPLTNNVIKLLSKYHRLWRGAPINAEDHPFVIDDSAQGVDYYFCKNNLSIFKKVITNKAIGAYEPPIIECK